MTTTTLPPQALASRPRRPERPRLPWRREDLFQEPAYGDGQPYARDDEDEDDAA